MIPTASDFYLDALLGHDRDMTVYLMSLSASLSDEELDRTFDIGHQTIRRTFDHIALAPAWWTAQLVGELILWEPNPGSIDAMRQRHLAVYAEFETVARDIRTQGQEDEVIRDAHGYP